MRTIYTLNWIKGYCYRILIYSMGIDSIINIPDWLIIQEQRMKILKTTLMVIVLGTIAFGQVVSSSHDLSTGGPTAQASDDQDRVCVFCHTPHNGGANELWNRTNPAATGDFAGLANSSLRCLSCHDGATAVNNLTDGTAADFTTAMAANTVIGNDGSGNPILVGDGDLGTDLSNDHPVGVDYPADGTAGFHNESTVNLANLPGGKVECSSCHDPHDTTFGAFMIASNSSSALCLDCHDK